MSKYGEYNSVMNLSLMLDDRRKIKDLFNMHCMRIIDFSNKNKGKYLPFVYNEKHGVFSFSFDFFVETMSKMYDEGNEEVENTICKDLKLSSSEGGRNKAELAHLHKNRTFIMLSILQDYYGIIYPNNKKINVTKLKGYLNLTSTYFVPIVYEDKAGEPIQYDTIPSKIENLLSLNVDEDLIEAMKIESKKRGLVDVAFNTSNCKKYWENQPLKTVLKFE